MVPKKTRPKIYLPKTKIERVGDLVTYVLFSSSLIYFIFSWKDMPAKIPAHFNTAGEITRWGSKWEMFLVIGINFFIIIFLAVCERFPEIHNYPKRFNEENASKFYLNSRQMLNGVKMMTSLLFSFLLFEWIFIAKNEHVGFGPLVFYLFIGGVFIPIVIGVVRQRKIK